jgi:hypothetical protein
MTCIYLVPFIGGIPKCFRDCLFNISCTYMYTCKKYSFAHQDLQSLLNMKMFNSIELSSGGFREQPSWPEHYMKSHERWDWAVTWGTFPFPQVPPRYEVPKCCLRKEIFDWPQVVHSFPSPCSQLGRVRLIFCPVLGVKTVWMRWCLWSPGCQTDL